METGLKDTTDTRDTGLKDTTDTRNQNMRVIEMSMSKSSVQMLIDLVEIKLGYLEISDRDDAREQRTLRTTLEELRSMIAKPGTVVVFPASEAGGKEATA